MKTFSSKEKRHLPARTALSTRKIPFCPDGARQARSVRQILGTTCLQAKLTVSTPGDPCELEADRIADAVMRMPDKTLARQPLEEEEELVQTKAEDWKSGVSQLPRRVEADEAPPARIEPIAGASRNLESDARACLASGHGRSMSSESLAFFEPRLGHDFSAVRIHTHAAAAALARKLNARAFTFGTDIGFADGKYQPVSTSGQRLMAHELTHVIQQQKSTASASRHGGASDSRVEEEWRQRVGGAVIDQRAGGSTCIQRDLAIEPPRPEATAAPLSESQIEAAIRYNRYRFKDPYSIMLVRDVVGIPRYPAVSDRDLAMAIASWQAQFGIAVDGQAGPVTTRSLMRELRAEDQRILARQLRQDNYVNWADVNAQAYSPCGNYQWDVDFRTSLRGGWLIQRIDNTWSASTAAGADATPAFTQRYWEAWWIDNAGDAWIPTNTATPPATAAPAVADDLWRVPAIPATSGTWSQAGRLYTALVLPAGFATFGVPEAMALPATTGPVNSDDLGLQEASRRVAGRWDCVDPDPARRFHRAT